MATCNVCVKPRSRVERVTVGSDGVVSVAVNALPSGGEANRRLVRLLSQVLGIAVSRVSIVRGGASRRKVVAIEGLEQGEVLRRVAASTQ